LGIHLLLGTGIKRDESAAIPLLRQACTAKDGESCYYLGIAYRDGKGVNSNKNEAGTFFSEGCDLKFKKACNP